MGHFKQVENRLDQLGCERVRATLIFMWKENNKYF